MIRGGSGHATITPAMTNDLSPIDPTPESPWFRLTDGALHCEGVPLTSVAAEHGTPTYVYSTTAVNDAYGAIDDAISFASRRMIAYAVKANGNLAILRLLRQLGSGVEVVSGGELARVLAAGFAPDKVVVSGVGKTRTEVEEAIDAGVRSLNMEGEAELDLISDVAGERGLTAPVSIRVNPDIDSGAHPYIATGLHETKFGMDTRTALRVADRARSERRLRLVGLSMHIGSQLASTEPLEEAVSVLGKMAVRLLESGHELEFVDVGGGWPIRYGDEDEMFPTAAAFGGAIRRGLDASGLGSDRLELMTEPGRFLVGDAGVLLTEVLSVKRTPKKTFVVVDGAITELIRPALYNAYHGIEPVSPRPSAMRADVVGPVCETGDFFAVDRALPDLETGDLVAIRSAGAYAREMSSTYNGRVPAAEVLVRGDLMARVRRRPEYGEALWAFEEEADL